MRESREFIRYFSLKDSKIARNGFKERKEKDEEGRGFQKGTLPARVVSNSQKVSFQSNHERSFKITHTRRIVACVATARLGKYPL